MITVGIMGSKGKSTVAEIIEQELKKQGKGVCVIGTNEDSSFQFMKLLYNEVDYVIIEISREDILEKRMEKIPFDILIQTALVEESEELINETQNLIYNIREKGYIIFNSDSIQKINFTCEEIYPITYGLNGKTTVTASSLDDMQLLCFSYCLQRALFTISDTIIQPFDKPVKVEGKNDDVYYYLAAYTCLLILGFTF